MKKLLTLAALLCLSLSAHAACSGSSPSWSCAAGSTVAQVNTVLGSITNGDTITFAAGSYTWNSQINLPNGQGVTLICATAPLTIGAATVNPCSVSTNTTVIGMANTLSGSNTNLYRISGFTFAESGVNLMIWIYGTGTLTQLRVDHNTMSGPSGSQMLFLGEQTHLAHFYGVADHNLVSCTNSCNFFESVGALNNSPPTDTFGTGLNFFLEDNTVNITTADNAGSGCSDGWGGDLGLVIRHNSSLNCLWTTHGVTHNGGPSNVEFYNNAPVVDAGSVAQGLQACFRCFHHQGSGTFVAFSNSFTAFSGKSGSALDMAHYRSYANGPSSDGNIAACDATDVIDGNRAPNGSNYGYPCWRQPGRDSFAVYKPMPTFNNFWSDTLAEINLNLDDFGGVVPNGSFPPNNCTTTAAGNCDYFTFQMQANRESYDAVSASKQSNATTPFNGTTGMGWGTLANRPTTCTTNATESGAGVMYGAGTSVGTIGSSGSGTAGDYVISTCSATNTWSAYYTPYTYPHPLVGGGAPATSYSPTPPIGFGNITQNTTSSPQTVTLTNTGSVNLVTTLIAMQTGTQFAIVTGGGAGTCVLAGQTIAASGSCTIKVTFTPTTLGAKTDNIQVTSNAASSVDNIQVTGTGVSGSTVGVGVSGGVTINGGVVVK